MARLNARLEHRIFYVAGFDDAVYVVHAFEKPTRQTPQRDVELARQRLANLTRRRIRRSERT